ncbi:hypothetical protein ACSW8S_19200 (plasmid) [Clostridium perfringens]
MADLFEFMLGKKKSKKIEPNIDENKNNYAIFMPVGVYDGNEESAEQLSQDDGSSYSSWLNKTASNQYESANASRRGDFSPYEIERMKSEEQLVELKRLLTMSEDEKKELKDKIIKLQNEVSELGVEKARYEYIAATYRSMVEKIVKIMPYYQEIEFTGIGTPEQWKDKKLVEVFVTCVEKIKLDVNQKSKEIEKLKSQVVSSSNKSSDTKKPSSSTIDDIEIPDINDDMLNQINIDNENNSIDIFDNDFPEIEEGDVLEDNYNPIEVESLQKYVDKLNDDEHLKVILETIGETGISRVVDLKETDRFKNTFVNSNGEFNQGTLSKKLKVLEDLGVLIVEKINTGRKGGNENIYSLSDIGINLYRYVFSAKPVESEKESIRRQHTSLEHGYFIKTVAKELENKGYEVFDSHEDCIRKPLLANADGDEKLRVEADLIIKKDDSEYIIECEMGTTSDSDMTKKLEKLILVTNVISFIMNNQDSLNATSAKVDKWITKKGRNNLKGYTFRFTTIDTLKKREVWQNKGPF